MKIQDFIPKLRETFNDISVVKLGIDSIVKQSNELLEFPASYAIDSFVGMTHQHDGLGGIMQSRRLENAYSDHPTEEGKLIKTQLEKAFYPVRMALRNKFGNTIKLYRGQGDISDKKHRSTLSWTSDPRIAALFVGITPMEAKLKPITDQDIVVALKKYHTTGKLKWHGKIYVRIDITTDDTNSDEYYYDILDSSGSMITDGDNIEEELRSYQEYYKEIINAREIKKTRIISAFVPVDNIIWITDRAGQSEFILHNKKDQVGFVDTNGKLKS